MCTARSVRDVSHTPGCSLTDRMPYVSLYHESLCTTNWPLLGTHNDLGCMCLLSPTVSREASPRSRHCREASKCSFRTFSKNTFASIDHSLANAMYEQSYLYTTLLHELCRSLRVVGLRLSPRIRLALAGGLVVFEWCVF